MLVRTPTWQQLYDLGRSALECHEYEDAETALIDALASAEDSGALADERLAATLNLLARLAARRKRPFVAVGLLRRQLAILERTHGEHDPQVAATLGNLAEMFSQLNALHDEREARARALAIRRADPFTDGCLTARLAARVAELDERLVDQPVERYAADRSWAATMPMIHELADAPEPEPAPHVAFVETSDDEDRAAVLEISTRPRLLSRVNHAAFMVASVARRAITAASAGRGRRITSIRSASMGAGARR